MKLKEILKEVKYWIDMIGEGRIDKEKRVVKEKRKG